MMIGKKTSMLLLTFVGASVAASAAPNSVASSSRLRPRALSKPSSRRAGLKAVHAKIQQQAARYFWFCSTSSRGAAVAVLVLLWPPR